MKLMRNRGFFWKTLSPIKRLVLLFGLAALAILALLSFFPLGDGKKTAKLNSPKTKEKIIQNLNKDSDSDGLKDWEEKIYGTGLENADTDGDGTPDGAEIKTSRNPLRPGPDDALSIPLPPPEDGNKTQALANELIGRSLTQVIAEGLSGQPLTELTADTARLQSDTEKLGQERILDGVIPPQNNELAV